MSVPITVCLVGVVAPLIFSISVISSVKFTAELAVVLVAVSVTALSPVICHLTSSALVVYDKVSDPSPAARELILFQVMLLFVFFRESDGCFIAVFSLYLNVSITDSSNVLALLNGLILLMPPRGVN